MEANEDAQDAAKIETTTDELKPNSGDSKRAETVETPASEKEEPLFKSSLRVKMQAKTKVSWVKTVGGRGYTSGLMMPY